MSSAGKVTVVFLTHISLPYFTPGDDEPARFVSPLKSLGGHYRREICMWPDKLLPGWQQQMLPPHQHIGRSERMPDLLD
jgi:hypothetical protein